jgi:hypothetical protein
MPLTEEDLLTLWNAERRAEVADDLIIGVREALTLMAQDGEEESLAYYVLVKALHKYEELSMAME